MITNTNYVSSWKSKGLSEESIEPPTTSDNILNPELNYYAKTSKIYWKLLVVLVLRLRGQFLFIFFL